MARRRALERKASANKPHYTIKMCPKGSFGKASGGWSTVGVAWLNENGFRIQLNRGVVLDWQDFTNDIDTNYILMMFERDDREV